MLIERGATVSARARDKDGQTPLHLALQAGQLDVVCMLIECGANVSVRNKDAFRTPFHVASQNGQLEVIRMLIERGTDVSAGTLPLNR